MTFTTDDRDAFILAAMLATKGVWAEEQLVRMSAIAKRMALEIEKTTA